MTDTDEKGFGNLKFSMKVTYAIMENLLGTTEELSRSFVTILADQLKIDRIAMFVNKDGRFILAASTRKDVPIGNDFGMFHKWLTNSIVAIDPTPGIGWDAYVKAKDSSGKLLAILLFDDTSTAREFSNDERTVLSTIGLALGRVFEFRERFRQALTP